MLERLLAEGLVDYVALDLKTAPERYGELHRGPVAVDRLQQSLDLLLAAPVDYEIRTTCVPGLVEAADLHALGRLVRGARRWFLQQFVPQHALDPALLTCSPHSPETLQAFSRLAAVYVDQVAIRGL